jgi:hypothetical protein
VEGGMTDVSMDGMEVVVGSSMVLIGPKKA